MQETSHQTQLQAQMEAQMQRQRLKRKHKLQKNGFDLFVIFMFVINTLHWIIASESFQSFVVFVNIISALCMLFYTNLTLS